MYSIQSPELAKTPYAINSKFAKTDWYDAWRHPDPRKWTLFPERDLARHADTRKPFQSLYSMSSLVNYEPFVDECTAFFSGQLTKYADRGEAIEIGHWFQGSAFDVIGNITYSQIFGFLDSGDDVANLPKALASVLRYGALVGIYGKWHPLVFKISTWLGLGDATGRNNLMQYVSDRTEEREDKTSKAEVAGEDAPSDRSKPADFLDRLTLANKQEPEKVTEYHVFVMGLSNIIAGSDTTAISFSAILYYLIRSPDSMRKLRAEIHKFERQGRCGNPDVTFKQSQDMPYLQAVLKEALRIRSTIGLPPWRYVPAGDAQIGGWDFPAGTTIGLNCWCAHY